MSHRSFDIMDFAKDCHQVKLESAINSHRHDEVMFEQKMNQVVAWCESRVQDEYLIMLNHVIFKNEQDAIMFQLGFQFHD